MYLYSLCLVKINDQLFIYFPAGGSETRGPPREVLVSTEEFPPDGAAQWPDPPGNGRFRWRGGEPAQCRDLPAGDPSDNSNTATATLKGKNYRKGAYIIFQ